MPLLKKIDKEKCRPTMITRSLKRKMETEISRWTDNGRNLKLDWLSNLPDVLILHILSYLDTKYAVQTCILSKRWRGLWEYVPALNLFSKSFDTAQLFENFISQFLKNHKACFVSSLSFHSLGLNQLFVSRVIQHAVSHGVQLVSVRSDSYSNHDCASCLVSSKALRSLRLEKCPLAVIPCLNFPCLKTLSLYRVRFCREFSKDGWMRGEPTDSEIDIPIDMFSSCVNLENLQLRKCLVAFVGDFSISCPQLVNLEASFTTFCFNPRKIVVCAPKLSYFKLGIHGWYDDFILSIDNSPRLHTVDFHTSTTYFNLQSNFWKENKEQYLFMFVNLFKALGTAKSLIISMATIKVLSQCSSMLENQICPFDNLENVKVLVENAKESVKVPEKVKQYLFSGSPNVKEILVERKML